MDKELLYSTLIIIAYSGLLLFVALVLAKEISEYHRSKEYKEFKKAWQEFKEALFKALYLEQACEWLNNKLVGRK